MQHWNATPIAQTKMAKLIFLEGKEIPAFNVGMRKRMMSKDLSPKLVAELEYGTVYQHQGMLLQNLYRRYLIS